jgi:lysophospholipase L1-like esterase
VSTIAPNNSGILYSPYGWDVSSTRAVTIQGGAYLRALIVGDPNDLVATFDTTGLLGVVPELLVRVDELPPVRVAIAPTITINTGSLQNNWGKHTVEILVAGTDNSVDRWNGGTAVRFTGFTSASNISLGTIRRRTRTVMAIGDSISEGFRVLRAGSGGDPSRNDSRLGWAYPLGDLLGAEVGVIGFAGVGISKPTGDGGVPKFGSSWKFLRNGVPRSFATTPDVVVINAGQNDSSYADATVQADMTAWLNDILATLPSVRVYVVRPWSGMKAAPIAAACAAVTAPSRVTYVDTAGWWNTADSPDGTHPYGYIHTADLSPRLADIVGNSLAIAPIGETGVWVKTSSGKKPLQLNIKA